MTPLIAATNVGRLFGNAVGQGAERSAVRILVAALLVGGIGVMSAGQPVDSVRATGYSNAPHQTTVNLPAVSDASIDMIFGDANFGAADTLDVQYLSSRQVRRALIRFNLAAAVPPEANIIGASLYLFQEGGQGADPVDLDLSVVTEDWVESQVTWNNRPATGGPTIRWPADQVPGYRSIDITPIVRAWHNVPHYGLELRGPVDGTVFSRVFESREHGENPPRLEVTYELNAAEPYAFSGNVFEGHPPDRSRPVGGITIELYGDEDEWPESGPKILLARGETDEAGQFDLEWEPPGLPFPYFHVIELDPPDTYSAGAEAEPPGYVKNLNVVSYLDIPPGHYGGSAFWDQRLAEDTPTATTIRATDTPTASPTPTGTLPPDCQELLENGDFETGDLPPWGRDGAVGLGPGRGSAHGAMLGDADNAGGELWQGVAIPAGAEPVRLEYWWIVESETEQPFDHLDVVVQYGNEQVEHLRTHRAVDPRGVWQRDVLDLTDFAGQEIAVTFVVSTDGEVPSTFLVDDVSLKACGVPTLTPTVEDTPPPTGTRTATPTSTPTFTATPTNIRPPTATATPPGEVTTWVVNTTADHDDGRCEPLEQGDCTLREAMREANERDGPDTILFDIPADDPGYDPDIGSWTIAPESDLPAMEDDGTAIDGRGPEESRSQAHALAQGPAPPCWASGKLVINFSKFSSGGFVASGANGSLVYLNIYGSDYYPAVSIAGTKTHHNTVWCNNIQGNPATKSYHLGEGVKIWNGAYQNRVATNTINGNSIGVYITSGPSGTAAAHHNTLVSNWIGSAAPGAVPNTKAGIIIDGGAHNNTIGGATDASVRNIVSGNSGPGIVIAGQGTGGNVVANNRVGVMASSAQSLPNQGAGVRLQQQASGNTIGPGNVIAFNKLYGVALSAYGGLPGPNVVTWNSIFDNVGKGIHNPRLAPPVLTFITTGQVTGTTSPKCGGCIVEVFSNPSHSATQPAEGKTPLGKVTTLTDGTWSWTGAVPWMSWVTATLTKNGDTSEFSTPKRATVVVLGKVCPPGQPLIKCWPDVHLSLWTKPSDKWEKIGSAISDEQGQFTLADNESAEVRTEYLLVMADVRYRVIGAESASGGDVREDGSIHFTGVEPRAYGGNIFYVEKGSPAEWVVNTTADHDDGGCDQLDQGDCTLREAINTANEHDGPAEIHFDIPPDDPGFEDGRWTIRPDTALPQLVGDGIAVDARLEPAPPSGSFADICAAKLLVVMDGTLMPPGMNGFVLNGSQQKLLGMILSNWPANGVHVTGAQADYNTVACNQLIDNLGDGVRIDSGADHTTVGGPLGGNLISGNSGDGVRITGSGTDFNRVVGNLVGTNEDGRTARANTGHGVHLTGGAQYNDVGGELAEHGNVIAGNSHSGVMIDGGNTAINRVGANLIGIAADGSSKLGNAHHGVGIYGGAVINQVGSSVLEPNVIGANGWSGVAIVNSNTNAVFGSYIGTDAGGAMDLGNGFYGVHVVGGSDNSVSSSTIAHNGADGVRVEGAAAVRNRITVSSITANGGKGIELVSGGNTELAPPVVTAFTSSSISGTACAGCTVEVFSDPADEGQHVHSPPYAFADSSGNWAWSGSVTGKNVTATAADGNGNTSEFSVVGWLFAGRVDLDTDPRFPRPVPVEVSLYGSDDPEELGERLAGVPTGRDGSYELRHGAADSRRLEYPVFNIVVADPAYDVARAESRSGGIITIDSRIRFEGIGPGAYGDNDFMLINFPPPDPTPKAGPWKIPTVPGPFKLIKPEDLVIDAIEVTQAIQCSDAAYPGKNKVCSDWNDLPLAAGKPAVVRVYAATNRSCHSPEIVAGARVDLTVSWGTGGYKTSTMYKVPCAKRISMFTSVGEDRRKGSLGSANFYLIVPTDRKISLFAEVNADKAWPEPDYTNNRFPATGTEDVEFKKRRPLSIGYLLVDYHPKPSQSWSGFKLWKQPKPGASWAASKAAYGLFDAIYPSGSLSYQKFGSGLWKYTGTDVRDSYTDSTTKKKVCGACEMLNQLTKQWQAWKLSGKYTPDQIFAWLPENARAPLGVGAADAPPPVHTGQGRAAFGEERQYQIVAHEVGHNLKLYHAPCPAKGQPGAPSGFLDPQWPYSNGLAQEIGFDVGRWNTKSTSASDIMSYCAERWISPYHWKKLFDELAPTATASSEVRAAPQSYVLVSGLVGRDDTGWLDPLIRLDSDAAPPDKPTGGEFCLTFYDSSDGPLASHCFDLSFTNVESGEQGDVAHFAHALPFPVAAARVALHHGGALVDERRASVNVPELALESPSGGEDWDGIQTVAWTAEDADGDALTFGVFYSHDNGATWLPVGMDLTATSFRLDTTSLPGSDRVQIRVLASDGFHTATVDSAPLVVPTKAPEVLVAAPGASAVLPVGQAVYLDGSAYDPEDGPVADTVLSWWSDREGLIGRGGTMILPGGTLSPGWHTIALRAADGDGQVGLARVDVYVGYRVYLPRNIQPRFR